MIGGEYKKNQETCGDVPGSSTSCKATDPVIIGPGAGLCM